MRSVITIEDLNQSINTEKALLVYFSHDHCNVCKVLKPKVKNLITSHYPKIQMLYCNTVNQPMIAAQQSIYTVPSILIWFQRKETFRFSRNIGLTELGNAINRPYHLLFDE